MVIRHTGIGYFARLEHSAFMKPLIAFLSVLALAAGLSGCGSDPPEASKGISATNAWMRFAGDSAAAYVTVKNQTTTPDTITGVAVPASIAGAAALHATTVDSAGLTGMHPSSSLDLPAGFTLTMKPGAFHFMLTDLKSRPAIGTVVPITVEFKSHPPITVDAEVR